MSRAIAPFGLRLPENLKKTLQNSAKSAHRSMNAELVLRLEESLQSRYSMHDAPRVVRAGKGQMGTREEPGSIYSAREEEREMIELFRKLSPGKQRALLDLLKS